MLLAVFGVRLDRFCVMCDRMMGPWSHAQGDADGAYNNHGWGSHISTVRWGDSAFGDDWAMQKLLFHVAPQSALR